MSQTLQTPEFAKGLPVAAQSTRPRGIIARALGLGRTRIGILFTLVIVAIAVLGPFLAPHSPTEFTALPSTAPGGEAGILGTDYLGRDVLSQFLYGGRNILFVAAVSTVIGLVAGTAIGLVAAYSRNAWDSILMRTLDVIMAFPRILLVLLVMSLVGPETWVIIPTVALGIAPGVARVVRGAAQPVVERDFVEAAEAMGVSRIRILAGELFPNILGPLMVESSLRLSGSIAVVASLAYLGFSSDPDSPNWGTMIQQNQISLSVQPWGALMPIIATALLTIGAGLIGDGIARTAAGVDRERGSE